MALGKANDDYLAIANTTSRKSEISVGEEHNLRQQTARFIQTMGQKLHVRQLCINTAIVYMHKFYMSHSFSVFCKYHISAAALFLASKVEKQERKTEQMIKVLDDCNQLQNTKSVKYPEKVQELHNNESILLQTLGFEVSIIHPHTYVIEICEKMKANRRFSEESYCLATSSLHLTTMCLEYPPYIVACVCIQVACVSLKNWVPACLSNYASGISWELYIDKPIDKNKIEELAGEFSFILEKSPRRLQSQIFQSHLLRKNQGRKEKKKKGQGNKGNHHSSARIGSTGTGERKHLQRRQKEDQNNQKSMLKTQSPKRLLDSPQEELINELYQRDYPEQQNHQPNQIESFNKSIDHPQKQYLNEQAELL